VVGHNLAEVAEAAETAGAADKHVVARTCCLLEVVPAAAGIRQLALWEIVSSLFHPNILIVYERVGADIVAVVQKSSVESDQLLTIDSGSDFVSRFDSLLERQAMREDVVQAQAQGHSLAEQVVIVVVVDSRSDQLRLA
jgi:hypothetical protein